MSIPHAYPGTFAAVYDRLQADAVTAGVCPKIIAGPGSSLAGTHACGRPLHLGTQFCERHQR